MRKTYFKPITEVVPLTMENIMEGDLHYSEGKRPEDSDAKGQLFFDEEDEQTAEYSAWSDD